MTALLAAAIMVAGAAGCSRAEKPGAPPLPTGAVGAAAPAVRPMPSPTAAPDISASFTCPPPTLTVATAAELRGALDEAQPGDSILLRPGTYRGRFETTLVATPEAPLYLCGPPTAVLDGGSTAEGYVLHVAGAQNLRINGFTVQNGQKGIMVDASRATVLQNLTVRNIGDEGIHLRDNSTGNVVRGSTISRTGLQDAKYGEGIYIGSARSNWCEITSCRPDRSDGNRIIGNRIENTTAESIDVKEGTSSGAISDNAFDGRGLAGKADSWVDVKGNFWTVSDNSGRFSPQDGFQTHVILTGWGNGNIFSRNTADVDGGSGVGFYLHQELTNRVSCDNTVSGATGGLSNFSCEG